LRKIVGVDQNTKNFFSGVFEPHAKFRERRCGPRFKADVGPEIFLF